MRRRHFLASLAATPLRAQNTAATTRHRAPRALNPAARASDWPSFLGPTHNGFSPETHIARAFPAAGPPLVWERTKGTGYSSPSLANGKLVFFHRMGNREIVECLHPDTGALLWNYDYPTAFEDRYGYNNGPRSSAVIAGGLVHTLGAEGKLHCLQLDSGKLVWKLDLRAEFGVKQDFFGVATTPLLDAGRLIVQIGAPGGPTLAAFDPRTGKQLWRAGKDWGPSYASPIPATVHGKRRIFLFAGGESQPPTGGLMMVDPASGAVEATFPWRSRSYESVNASCPVITENQVFISASYRAGGAMLAITPDMKFKPLWTTPGFGLHFNTPIWKDGHLYGFDGRNEPDASLACVNAATGTVVWRHNPEWKESLNGREQLLSTYRGNLLHVDGRFLALGELGHLLWMDLSPARYKESSRAWLFAARETWSPPVLSRGLLYLVQHTRDPLHGTSPRLLCYDLRAE